MFPITTKCIFGKSFFKRFNALSEKSRPFKGTSALAVVINLHLSLSIFSIGANSSVSIPLLITVILSFMHLNSLIIPFLELFEGVIIFFK